MSFSLHYHSNENVLEFKFTGVYNLLSMRESTAKLTEAIEKYGCLYILNDFREAKIEMTITDIFIAAKKCEFSGKRRDIARAYVYTSDTRLFDFFETTSRNNGQRVQVFQNYDEAKTWLLECKPVRKNGELLSLVSSS